MNTVQEFSKKIYKSFRETALKPLPKKLHHSHHKCENLDSHYHKTCHRMMENNNNNWFMFTTFYTENLPRGKVVAQKNIYFPTENLVVKFLV